MLLSRPTYATNTVYIEAKGGRVYASGSGCSRSRLAIRARRRQGYHIDDPLEWDRQGLTFVHFSPQPQPFSSLKSPNVPKQMLTSIRRVDECKPHDGRTTLVHVSAQ